MGAQHSKRFHGTLQSSPAIRRTRSRSNSQHNDGSLRLMVVADYVRLSPPCTFCTHRSRSRHRDPQRVRYVYRPHSYPAQDGPTTAHSLFSFARDRPFAHPPLPFSRRGGSHHHFATRYVPSSRHPRFTPDPSLTLSSHTGQCHDAPHCGDVANSKVTAPLTRCVGVLSHACPASRSGICACMYCWSSLLPVFAHSLRSLALPHYTV